MKITFARTGNVYLNAGIVGIAVTLDQYDIWRQKTEPVTEELPQHTWGWEGNALQVSAEEPLKLLELIYKVMGQQYYNTSTMDALAKMTNFWYEPDTDEFHPFPKMKTYGFGGLLTNDAAGKTPREENTIRRKAIKPGDAFGQMLEQKYIALFEEKGLKLGQQLYINEPYAKITRLKLEEADIAPGKLSCPITGEKFKRLQPAISVSPTTSGLKNFLPGLSSKGDKIGWKAMFMIRFSPVLALYRYAAGLDTLFCYFYDHPHLPSLYRKYHQYKGKIYLDEQAKLESKHLNNIRLASLSLGDKIEFKLKGNDFVHPNEVLFQLIYTLTESFYDKDTDGAGLLEEMEDEDGINLYMLRADKFAGTMRPNTFSAFNHFAYVRRYIKEAREVGGIQWGQIMASLKIHLPGKERDWAKERLPREALIKKLMTGQPFLEELKAIYLGGFTLRLSGEGAGFKRWDQLEKLLKFNEFGPLKNYSTMEKDFHERAYKLGTQIGQAIIHHADGGASPKDRAKFGRKYIIDLDKSRTYEDLLEALKRIQLRYGTSLSKDLIIDPVTETNFRTVKLLATIGALNVLNGKMSFDKNDNQTK
jgi:hypothetical protein